MRETSKHSGSRPRGGVGLRVVLGGAEGGGGVGGHAGNK